MAQLSAGMLAGFFPLVHKGKVRESFEIPDHPDLLLVFATNGISTHNIVHASEIPGKGSILTAMTIHWLREVFADLLHHLVASGREIYQYLPAGMRENFPGLHYQAVVVKRLQMAPVEFIYRRHLVEAGSLWRLYQAGEDPYGLRLPKGLPVMHRFANPIFTPTDKSATDDPRRANDVRDFFERETALTARIFLRGEEYLAEKGLVLLDSKLEAGRVRIADETLTPDSSRFATAEEVERAMREERDPAWLDKEFVRAEATRLWKGGPKVPLTFSEDVIKGTTGRYVDILTRITGHCLADWMMDQRFDFHV